jgi:tRNA (uracil-5-)-methyltransferase TRM9
MNKDTAKKLLKKVHDDYTNIASEFSQTRQRPWQDFSLFKPYIKSGDSIVDVGCGNGRLYTFLRDISDISYTGIDNNEALIKHAQKNYSSTNFLVADLLDLPRGVKYDILFSIASLHHIPSQELRNKSVREMNQILKKNGTVIITVWNLFQKRYRKHIIRSLFNFFIQFGRYDWNDTFIPWGKSGIKRYYHAFTPGEIKKLFTENGFIVKKILYTKKGRTVPFLKSHNICLICKKR